MTQCHWCDDGRFPRFRIPYSNEFRHSVPEPVGEAGCLRGPDESDAMHGLLSDVRAFHEACGVPVLTSPTVPPIERVQLRERLLIEEVHEFESASARADLVEVADALADIIYIAVGTALEYGIPLDRVWAEVQRSNMAKVDPESGKAKHRDDGKILKPQNWTPPRIKEALGLQ